MDQRSLDLLTTLTEAPGPPGHEDEVRALVAREAEGLAEVSHDRLGSIICRKAGSAAEPRVMIPAHMDEIGFVVNAITDEGFLRFSPLGGWWDHVVLAQRVVVKARGGDAVGIIGSKPPHVLTDEERKKLVKRREMFIDVGAKDKQEATEGFGIRVGDPVVPICPFTPLRNPKMLMGKAFDDRAGVAIMLDVLRQLDQGPHPNTVYGVGTVQEEVGTRGAETSADAVDPHVAIVAEVGIATDIPGGRAEDKEKGTLGQGPQVCFLDSGLIPNLKLRDFVVGVAEAEGIPYQIAILERGTTDGRPIHLHGIGVPTVYIGVATRYIHSHAGILHADDYAHAVRLIAESVRRLDAPTVESFYP
ncbi:MAG: M42 family metallopeptidase [Candidatus Brocadiia bacterium]